MTFNASIDDYNELKDLMKGYKTIEDCPDKVKQRSKVISICIIYNLTALRLFVI